MTSLDILPGEAPVQFGVSLGRMGTHYALAGVFERFPGVEDHLWLKRADYRLPDEMAALYDDLVHEVHVSKQLLECVMTDFLAPRLV